MMMQIYNASGRWPRTSDVCLAMFNDNFPPSVAKNWVWQKWNPISRCMIYVSTMFFYVSSMDTSVKHPLVTVKTLVNHRQGSARSSYTETRSRISTWETGCVRPKMTQLFSYVYSAFIYVIFIYICIICIYNYIYVYICILYDIGLSYAIVVLSSESSQSWYRCLDVAEKCWNKLIDCVEKLIMGGWITSMYGTATLYGIVRYTVFLKYDKYFIDVASGIG